MVGKNVVFTVMALLGLAFQLPSLADEPVIMEQHSSLTTSSSSSSAQPGSDAGGDSSRTVQANNYHFQTRIKDLGSQIDLAVSKGWLTADEAAGFKKEERRLAAMEKNIRDQGYPRVKLDSLESGITLLNENVNKAMNKPRTARAAATAGSAKPGKANSNTSK